MRVNDIVNKALWYEKRGKLEEALELYQTALRSITPDDVGFEMAFAMNGPEAKGICEYPAEDKLDSLRDILGPGNLGGWVG